MHAVFGRDRFSFESGAYTSPTVVAMMERARAVRCRRSSCNGKFVDGRDCELLADVLSVVSQSRMLLCFVLLLIFGQRKFFQKRKEIRSTRKIKERNNKMINSRANFTISPSILTRILNCPLYFNLLHPFLLYS